MATTTIDKDIAEHRAHPFLRRRLTDAMMMHLVDGLMLFVAMWIGDFALYCINGIPIQLKPILLLIPCWWVGTWLVHLVPGWGMGVIEELRRMQQWSTRAF